MLIVSVDAIDLAKAHEPITSTWQHSLASSTHIESYAHVGGGAGVGGGSVGTATYLLLLRLRMNCTLISSPFTGRGSQGPSYSFNGATASGGASTVSLVFDFLKPKAPARHKRSQKPEAITKQVVLRSPDEQMLD